MKLDQSLACAAALARVGLCATPAKAIWISLQPIKLWDQEFGSVRKSLARSMAILIKQ